MTAKPNRKKMMEPTEKSRKFFIMILPADLARVNPASTQPKPACMSMTRIPATRVHRILPLDWVRYSTSPADAKVGTKTGTNAATPVASLLETWVGDFLENIDLLLSQTGCFS